MQPKTELPKSEREKSLEREMRLQTLRSIIAENNKLPPNERLSKYDILIKAGYPEHVAASLSGNLIENGKMKVIPKRGFDVDSAKLTIQEIAHDPLVKDETRLKAAEDILKVYGEFDDSNASDKVAGTLAEILRDVFKSNSNKPKIFQQAQRIYPESETPKEVPVVSLIGETSSIAENESTEVKVTKAEIIEAKVTEPKKRGRKKK